MKKNKLPNLVTILILTLITVLMWVGLNIYRAFTIAPEPSVPENVLAPLTPTLDTATISKIESSLFFDESQIPQINFLATPTPAPVSLPSATPTPTEIPVVTAAETPIPTETPIP